MPIRAPQIWQLATFRIRAVMTQLIFTTYCNMCQPGLVKVLELYVGERDFCDIFRPCVSLTFNSTQLTTSKEEWINKRKEAKKLIYIPDSLVNSQDVS